VCDLLQIAELKSGVAQPADAAFLPPTARANSRNGSTSAYATISVTVVGEFVHWNEEAVARCNLLMSQAAPLATNVRAVFLCLLDQVNPLKTWESLRMNTTLQS
jgi:hypothetical protein